MTSFIRTIFTSSMVAALAACGDRTVGDDGASALPPPDVGDSADPSADDDGSVICREGLTPCDGECVDFSSNDQHCGACGHACKEPWVFGGCLDGACPSAHWCGEVDEGFETCEDLCAFHGQLCDEGPRVGSRGCGGGYRLYFDHDALERCEIGLGGDTGLPATCATPIDWSIEGGWDDEPARAVSCCCTQDPP